MHFVNNKTAIFSINIFYSSVNVEVTSNRQIQSICGSWRINIIEIVAFINNKASIKTMFMIIMAIIINYSKKD